MPKETLQPGITHSNRLRVDDSLTVPRVSPHYTGFADMPEVFATAFLVGFAEWTCIEALRPHLLPGEHSVGVQVNLSHVAATPPGMQVTAEVALIEREGKRLRFRVLVRDEREIVSEGTHDRFIIDQERFLAKAHTKAA
jgi:fluoroacetyl-CoA thioesterase